MNGTCVSGTITLCCTKYGDVGSEASAEGEKNHGPKCQRARRARLLLHRNNHQQEILKDVEHVKVFRCRNVTESQHV